MSFFFFQTRYNFVLKSEHAQGETVDSNGDCNEDTHVLSFFNSTEKSNPLCCPKQLFEKQQSWEIKIVKTCGNQCYVTGLK